MLSIIYVISWCSSAMLPEIVEGLGFAIRTNMALFLCHFSLFVFVSPIVILTAPLFLLKLIITSPLPCVCTAERPPRARAESDWNKSSGDRSAYSANTVHVASATSESRPTTTTGSPRFPPLSPTYKTYQMLTPLYLERVTIDQPQ